MRNNKQLPNLESDRHQNYFLLYFKPSLYVKSIAKIDFQVIKNAGIKCLVCDLDGTLISLEYQNVPKYDAIEFVERAKQHGLRFILASNNRPSRVKKIAQKLKITEYYGYSFKPLTKVLKRIKQKHNYAERELMVIGNTLITDILMANRMGVESILVHGYDKNRNTLTKLTERFVYKKLAKNNILQKGIYVANPGTEKAELL